MKITDHLLESARQVPSPNCGDRPNQDDIDLIVIHSISLPPGQYGGGQIEQFFVMNWMVQSTLILNK